MFATEAKKQSPPPHTHLCKKLVIDENILLAVFAFLAPASIEQVCTFFFNISFRLRMIHYSLDSSVTYSVKHPFRLDPKAGVGTARGGTTGIPVAVSGDGGHPVV